jgi:hypothetical protein
MNELLFIAVVCTYLWPGADDTTYQLCYELVELSDKSQLTNEAKIGGLFIGPLNNNFPDLPHRKRPAMGKEIRES